MKALIFLSLVFLCLYPCKGIAQPAYWDHVKTDQQGNIYVLAQYDGQIKIDGFILGDSSSFHTYTHACYFIAKFSPSGTAIWADSIVGITAGGCSGACASPIGLSIDHQGNIIIAVEAADSLTYRGHAYYRPSVIKLDLNGNVLWAKQITTDNDITYAGAHVAVDNKDNIYYASLFLYNVSSDTVNLFTCDSNSAKTFVVKISGNGAAKWIREIASPAGGHPVSSQECFFITADSGGNSYVGGTANDTLSLGTTTFNCAGFYPFIAKLDSNGNPGFLKGYFNKWILGTAYSNLSDGCVSADQKLYVSGTFRDTVNVSSGNYVVTQPNVLTPYLAHTNAANGDALWYQYDKSTLGNWNHFYSLSSDGHNNLFAIGDMQSTLDFSGTGGLVALSPGLSNTYFAKFDSAGNFVCYQTDSSSLITGTAFDSSYYTIGVANDSVSSCCGIHSNSVELVKWNINTCSQVWRNHFDQYGTIPVELYAQQVNNTADNNLVFYPNPGPTGLFYKKYSNNYHHKESQLRIYNILGREINFINNPGFIDIKDQPKGIYLYRIIYDDQQSQTGKIIYQ